MIKVANKEEQVTPLLDGTHAKEKRTQASERSPRRKLSGVLQVVVLAVTRDTEECKQEDADLINIRKAASVLPFSNRIRAASFKFGIGVQSRKVLEWDPKEELLRKSVPMEFKMQDYNRKGKQTIDVDLSSESVSGFSDEIQVGKLMVTEEGGLPSKVNSQDHHMDVTVSVASPDASMTSGNVVTSVLAGNVVDNSVIFSGASINDSMPSGNAVSSDMECNSMGNSVTFIEDLTSGKDGSDMLCNLVENSVAFSEDSINVGLPFGNVESLGFLSDASSSFDGVRLVVPNFADGVPSYNPNITEYFEKHDHESYEASSEEGKDGSSAHAHITHVFYLGPLDILEASDRDVEQGKSDLHAASQVVYKGLQRFEAGHAASCGYLSSVENKADSGDVCVEHKADRGVVGDSGGMHKDSLGSHYEDPFLKEVSQGSISVSSLGSSLNPVSANEYDSSNPSFCSYGNGERHKGYRDYNRLACLLIFYFIFFGDMQRTGRRIQTTMVKGKILKLTTPNPYIPHDILFFGLLVRVPVKSLLRFKCVSKLWYAIIGEPDFIEAHLTCKKEQSTSSIVGFFQVKYKDSKKGGCD
ncbi:hypothetical protein IFM89_025727 [Coptis chinensis]|uniref:F-box protein n=1 Tax=Coptis chinensis TaxID=261450 RepID=A0A835I758_9MAGN|nr:hypothetical protein IFM89_025727 [Coptis chinensis]